MESSSPSSPDQGLEQPKQQQPPPPESPVANNTPKQPPKKRQQTRIRYCSVESCTNQVKKWGVCTRHGATRNRPLCTVEGCTKQAITQAEGLCIRHGATIVRRPPKPKQPCSHPGCSNRVQNNGVCIQHGAKTYDKKCNEEGCTKRGVREGLCKRHYSASVRRKSVSGSEVERCVVIDKQHSEEPSNYTTASNPHPTNRDYTSPMSTAHHNGMTYAAMINLINVQTQFLAEKDLYIVQLQNTIGQLLARDGNVNGNNANGNNAKVAEQSELLEL